jgi:hypothetical protein
VIAVFLLIFRGQVAEMMDPITDFTGSRQINRAGTWKVESLIVGNEPITVETGALLFFDFNRRCVYVNGYGRRAGTFEAQKARRTFRIQDVPLGQSSEAIVGSYRIAGDRLLLDGHTGGTPMSLVLRRHRWGR